MHSDGDATRGLLDSQETDDLPDTAMATHVNSVNNSHNVIWLSGRGVFSFIPSGSGTENLMVSAVSISPSSEVAITMRECGPGLKEVRSITKVPSSSPGKKYPL